ncbi:MAG: hypothetical protein QXQ47_06815 [Candidatus Bathyarchaeia archaeon]
MEQVKNNRQIVRASFNVEKDVLDEFRKAVAQKYGRLWGVLCLEFEKALKLRLEQLQAEIKKD